MHQISCSLIKMLYKTQKHNKFIFKYFLLFVNGPMAYNIYYTPADNRILFNWVCKLLIFTQFSRSTNNFHKLVSDYFHSIKISKANVALLNIPCIPLHNVFFFSFKSSVKMIRSEEKEMA